jgi:hypothetical protein
MNAMSAPDADALRPRTLVEVETAAGSYRGELTRTHNCDSDVELRYAGHHIRLHQWCVYRVRGLDTTAPPG